MDLPIQLSETEKYRRCYASPKYGLQGARLKRVTQDIEKIPANAFYLDVGCGRGEMVMLANSRGVLAWGIELVPELCGGNVLHGSLDALPFEDKAFDYVSCYDVVEHLPTDEVDHALDELFRICRRVLLITTNDKPSFYQGMPLHLTRKPRAWWDQKLVDRLMAFGSLTARIVRSTYGRDEWHWRLELD